MPSVFPDRRFQLSLLRTFDIVDTLLQEKHKLSNHKKYSHASFSSLVYMWFITNQIYIGIRPCLDCESKGTFQSYAALGSTNKVYSILFLPGGSLDLSMSMATTLMMRIQMGQSRRSGSDLTKATALRHWHSRRRLSGYALCSSRLTFCWNFFMSNSWNGEKWKFR
jgi:hypothetical protein